MKYIKTFHNNIKCRITGYVFYNPVSAVMFILESNHSSTIFSKSNF